MLCLGFSIGVMGSFKVYRKLEKTGRHEGRKGKDMYHVWLELEVSGLCPISALLLAVSCVDLLI